MNKLHLTIKQFWQTYKTDILIFVAVLIVAAVPRLLRLDTFLTADEKTWIGRAYEFVRAFKDFRFNDMLQTTHPGVTTLWIVGLAIYAKMFISHIPYSTANLGSFVHISQFIVALVNTLAVPVIYIFLQKLFNNRWLSGSAAILIALDPELIGYSRVAHVDAMMTSFLFLCCLAVIIYAKEHWSRRWLLISAVCLALAVLTKIPAIFAVPFFILTVMVYKLAAGNFWRDKVFWIARARDFITWSILGLLIFLFLWPAILWVPNPQGNVLVLKRDFVAAVETPHDMTQDYSLNPWLYPAALLTRTTPMVLVLSLLFVGLNAWQILKKKSWQAVPKEYWLLMAYVFFFVTMMTIGAKKGDRYILAVWPALSVMSVLTVHMVFVRRAAWGQAKLVLGVIVACLVFINIHYFPYEISYSDPWLPDDLSQSLGWGEGLDQVAAWFNQHAPNAVVASWYPVEMGTFTTAHVANITAHEQFNVQYVVLYRNMFGRAADNPANDFIDEYYSKKIPVFVAHIVGKEFAWIYEKRVYGQILGELLPGHDMAQPVQVAKDSLHGVDILLATYSGRAKDGTVQVTLKDGTTILHVWQVPVNTISDTSYTRLLLPQPLNLEGEEVIIDVSATGTAPNDAPTLRYTNQHVYRSDQLLIDGQPHTGNIGVDLLYLMPNNQIATEEDGKLLEQLK